MSADTIAYKVAAEQGWTDSTLLDVVLDYVENQQSPDAFADYLASRSATEDDFGEEDDTDVEEVFDLGLDTEDGDVSDNADTGPAEPGSLATPIHAATESDVRAIIDRKRAGASPTSEESEVVKSFLGRVPFDPASPTGIHADISTHLPLEWDEVLGLTER